MRIILMFDLPMTDDKTKKEYTKFKNHLTKLGYSMMQYSVYVRTILDKSKYDQELKRVGKYLPTDGNIRLLLITEKQYHDMQILLGKKNYDEIYNDASRYIKV